MKFLLIHQIDQTPTYALIHLVLLILIYDLLSYKCVQHNTCKKMYMMKFGIQLVVLIKIKRDNFWYHIKMGFFLLINKLMMKLFQMLIASGHKITWHLYIILC